MYEKKNKLSQPASILDVISVRLSDDIYRNINEKCFLEYVLPTPPLG